MTKKKPHYMQQTSRKLDEKLASAEEFIESKDYLAAREILVELEKRHPDHAENVGAG